jgi:hypothetical protein
MDKDKFYSKVCARLNKTGYRGDLYISDYRPIDSKCAQLLVAYSSAFGLPNVDDVLNYVLKFSEGKMIPATETLKVFEKHNCTSVIAMLHTQTRPLSDSDKMCAVVQGSLYIDSEIPATWEVVDREGTKYLARVEKEDIATIIKSRKSRMQMRPSSSVTFAQLSASYAVASTPQVDDTVKFINRDRIWEGKITKLNSIQASIKVGEVTMEVEPKAIFEVAVLGAKSKGAVDKKVLEYYRKLYGDDYVKKLFPNAKI